MNNQLLSHTAAVVLAAGRGTRMKAKNTNKVAFKLNGKPMVRHTVEHILESGVKQCIAVIGFSAESVRRALDNLVTYVVQPEAKGTGDALKMAIPVLDPDIDTVLTVYGDDSAFYPVQLYLDMVARLHAEKADLLVLTIHKEDPTGLGRIVRDSRGELKKIVEEKNASAAEKMIKEINTGFYCFNKDFLTKYIDQIQQNPISKEYYATDMVEIALKAGKRVVAYYQENGNIWHGVNNRSDFAKAQRKASLHG